MNFQQRKLTDCDTIGLKEYDNLVASETKTLQTKVSLAIDNALKTIEKKQTELMTIIKNDPRKSSMDSMSLSLKLKIKNHLLNQKDISNQAKSQHAVTTGKLLVSELNEPGSFQNKFEGSSFEPIRIFRNFISLLVHHLPKKYVNHYFVM